MISKASSSCSCVMFSQDSSSYSCVMFFQASSSCSCAQFFIIFVLNDLGCCKKNESSENLTPFIASPSSPAASAAPLKLLFQTPSEGVKPARRRRPICPRPSWYARPPVCWPAPASSGSSRPCHPLPYPSATERADFCKLQVGLANS